MFTKFMPSMMNLVLGFLTLAYPFAVYFGVQYAEPRNIAVLLIGILALRQVSGGDKAHGGRLLLIAGMVFCALAIWRNDMITLRFYPVVMNAAMLMLFAWSLSHPPTLVERLARLRHPDLPPSGIAYTRRVTQVWCGFFMLNGSIALATALWGSFEIWSLYNGLVAYLLMGALFSGEYLVRMRTQKHAG